MHGTTEDNKLEAHRHGLSNKRQVNSSLHKDRTEVYTPYDHAVRGQMFPEEGVGATHPSDLQPVRNNDP